jgi:5-methyltetrahydropteroyltriglutamate--homocysteine methyltransferase
MPERTKSNPPFHAEHIGSLLRPPELREAFRAHSEGRLTDDAFHEAQDRAIAEAVALQETIGLGMCTDGEFRRASYWGHWVDAIDGFGTATALFTFHDEAGNEREFIAANCVGKLHKAKPISTEEFKYLKSVAHGTPKVTMPSPSTLHFWRLSETIEGTPYASNEDFMADLTAIYRQEIADLYDLGCRYVQLDEVPLIMLANPNIQEQVRRFGDDPGKFTDLYIQAMNDAVRDAPADMTTGMHMCRGNFKGRWLTEGGYDDMAEKVFGQVAVDAFFLEYDTDRAGGFEPLRFVPEGKMVVLGLVSTKTPEMEDRERLKARIEEAAQYLPLDRLAISPQCGFASTVAGNPVTAEDEVAKLRLLVDVAAEVWG